MTHTLQKRHSLRLTWRAMLAGTSALLAARQSRLVFAEDKPIELGFVYWETKTDAFVQMANGRLAVAALEPRVQSRHGVNL